MPRRRRSKFKELCYEVVLKTRTPLLGSVPTDSGMIVYWLRERTRQLYGTKEVLMRLPQVEAEFRKHLENYEKVARMRLGELEEEEGEEKKSYNILLFLRLPNVKELNKGACVEQYHVAGVLKTAASLLGMSRQVPKIGDKIRTVPFDIPVYAEGFEEYAPIQFPYVRYVRGMTARGPRSTVIFHEFIEPPAYMRFRLYTFGIDEETLIDLFEYASKYLGLLAGRHHEGGRFDIVKLERVKEGEEGEKEEGEG